MRVEVLTSEADPEQFAKNALKRRSQGISKQDSSTLLALTGVALMPYHESTTFFGEKAQVAFVAPSGLVDGNTVRKVVEKNVGGKYVEVVETLRIGATPIILDAEKYGRVEFLHQWS